MYLRRWVSPNFSNSFIQAGRHRHPGSIGKALQPHRIPSGHIQQPACSEVHYKMYLCRCVHQEVEVLNRNHSDMQGKGGIVSLPSVNLICTACLRLPESLVH